MAELKSVPWTVETMLTVERQRLDLTIPPEPGNC